MWSKWNYCSNVFAVWYGKVKSGGSFAVCVCVCVVNIIIFAPSLDNRAYEKLHRNCAFVYRCKAHSIWPIFNNLESTVKCFGATKILFQNVPIYHSFRLLCSSWWYAIHSRTAVMRIIYHFWQHYYYYLHESKLCIILAKVISGMMKYILIIIVMVC